MRTVAAATQNNEKNMFATENFVVVGVVRGNPRVAKEKFNFFPGINVANCDLFQTQSIYLS